MLLVLCPFARGKWGLLFPSQYHCSRPFESCHCTRFAFLWGTLFVCLTFLHTAAVTSRKCPKKSALHSVPLYMMNPFLWHAVREVFFGVIPAGCSELKKIKTKEATSIIKWLNNGHRQNRWPWTEWFTVCDHISWCVADKHNSWTIWNEKKMRWNTWNKACVRDALQLTMKTTMPCDPSEMYTNNCTSMEKTASTVCWGNYM